MYDPIPDLAALIDGFTALLDQGRSGASNADLAFRLGMLAGDRPWSRLRGGLLLDDPGHEDVTTEQAIRTALAQAQAGYPGPLPVSGDPYAWTPTGGMAGPGAVRDLPVIDADTAVMSYSKLINHYQKTWPEERTREVRRRLLDLAAALPESERERMPAWLLTAIHTDRREQPS
jgi:hypothetical protein